MKLTLTYSGRNVIEAHTLSMGVYSAFSDKRVMPNFVCNEFNPSTGMGKLVYTITEADSKYGQNGLAAMLKDLKFDAITLHDD